MSRLWNALRRSLGLSHSKFVGQDQFGNKYYEKVIETIKGPQHRRYIDRSLRDLENANIPHEWDAWLRRTRENPPSLQEIERNNLMKLRIQQKVTELEQQMIEEGETGEESSEMKNISSTLTSGSLREKQKFPIYEEYEVHPGLSDKKGNQR